MCGRYALSLRTSQVRQRLADQDMPVDEAPDDDAMRPTYNLPPGHHGLIYRANTSERGGQDEHSAADDDNNDDDDEQPARKRTKLSRPQEETTAGTSYKLQTATWGLIPFWTKRAPDYSSKMKTINCRSDSLIENRGMWNTMKQRKRCIVVAEGFYEWLKKNGGKDRIPHFTKRKDGQLMCFAGLWDCVRYEGTPETEEGLWTYTIITTESNKQLSFLHDRMPVILEPGSEAMRAWLDPSRVGWDSELQGMLKPFQGELECYPVDKGVGKVGNNSPQFVVPVDSKENPKNIANFFGRQKDTAKTAKDVAAKGQEAKGAVREDASANAGADEVGKGVGDGEEGLVTSKVEDPESNAPLPKPEDEPDEALRQAIKEEPTEAATNDLETEQEDIKREVDRIDDAILMKAAEKNTSPSPAKASQAKKTQGTKRSRSAITNGTVAKTPTKEGNARITSFFGK